MDENIQTTSEAGSGTDTTQTQVADSPSQEASQVQSSEHSSQVGNDAPSASSQGKQTSKNSYYAQNRIIQKEINRAISPLLEEIRALRNPSVPQVEVPQQKIDIDYNDLPGSINRLVELATKQRLEEFEKTKLSSVRSELEESLTRREARNFLKSQPEIGEDEEKLDEIKNIMKTEGLDYMAIYEPVRAVKKATEIWKSRRTNPNTPKKETLTTITGGAVNNSKRTPTAQELRDLQKIITSDAPETEKQAAYEKIEAISKMSY